MRKYTLLFFFSCVLIATVFFDDPHLYFYKRVIYAIFMLLSLWQIYLFNYKRPVLSEDLPMPRWYRPFITLFMVFIGMALLLDLFNPLLSLVTLLNHPLAMLAVVPVFAFRIGFQTDKMNDFIKFLIVTAVFFCIFFAFPMAAKNANSQGVACCYAVLPLTLFAIELKKYRFLIFILIMLSMVFSQVSDSRTIALRIMLFFGLLVSLSMVKKWSSMKFLVIVVTAFFIFQFLTNLETYLEFFKSFIHVKNFDDEDTRTFLYEELFADMKPHELIFGRGFLGTYFSPYFLWQQLQNQDFTGDAYYRFSVEVGFLQFLLKGGVIYFVLYITPLVAVVYRGLFTRHTSRIAFLISVYILCELLVMFIENIPSYHFQFFIMFFLAGYAYRQTILHKVVSHEDIGHYPVLQPGTVY